MNPIEKKIAEVIDATMPGRRIGSTPPKDWTAQVQNDCDRVFCALPGDLGLTSLRKFCAGNGLPTDEGYLKAFRREAIRTTMIDALERARDLAAQLDETEGQP